MSRRYPRLPLLAAPILLLLGASTAFAQKPEWTPIAELLVGSLGASDPVRMSDVMTRCTAINMILAGLASDEAPDAAQLYQDEAHRLIQHAVLIDSQLEQQQTGVEADIPALSNATIEEVKGMVSGYNLWLDDNLATGDSLFSKDFTLEVDSCRLASKFVSQMQNG